MRSPGGEHRRNLLRILVNLRTWSEPGLHLLVTSREEADIRDELSASHDEMKAHNDSRTLIDITVTTKNDRVNDDIITFVSYQLKANRQLRKWEKFSDEIQAVLINTAKGESVSTSTNI
jgi:ankyrin repeat domain-containing protein 50